MLSAGLLFTPRFSWRASVVKLGFFAFVQFPAIAAPMDAADWLEVGFARPGEHTTPSGFNYSRAPSASSTISRGPDRLGLVQRCDM
jgi:hypothetical protein